MRRQLFRKYFRFSGSGQTERWSGRWRFATVVKAIIKITVEAEATQFISSSLASFAPKELGRF